MRPVGALSKFLGFALAVAAFATASVEAAPRQNQAVVRAVRGTANYSTDAGANWKNLSVGMRLNQNSVIRTAPGSVVDLFLGDNGPVVRVTEATTMGIDKLTSEQVNNETVIETQLDLRNGRILGNVKKLADASKYEVKTPQGVAGIRGTRYDIRADGTVTVLDGTVIVVYVVGGQPIPAVVVNAGQTVRPPTQAGQPVTPSPADRGVLDDLGRQLDQAGRPPVDGPTGTPTVVIVVEPKEALQEADRSKTGEVPDASPAGGGQ
jgi:hypothetical protein